MEVPQSEQSLIHYGRRHRHLHPFLHPKSPLSFPFPPITACSSGSHRASQTAVADLDGTLLIGRSAFPYFFLVAFEAGSYLRAWMLLLATPVIAFLYYFVRESSGIQLMIFIAFCGLPLRDIEASARAVVPKFYLEDLHPTSWPVFASFGTRVVLTANPRVLVEPFLKEILGVDEVLGTEIEVTKGGRATGFAKKPQGVLVGKQKEEALKRWIMDREAKRTKNCGGWRLDVGMGDRETDFGFMAMCKVRFGFRFSLLLGFGKRRGKCA